MLFSDLFSRLGLNENEARIYELLLLKGETKARSLLEDSGLTRGNVYNVLTSLVSRGLVQVTEGKQQMYQVTDPTKLSGLVDAQKQKIDRLDVEFKTELPKILSTSPSQPAAQLYGYLRGWRGQKRRHSIR